MQVLTINGSDFHVATAHELATTKAAISAAMVAGGAFVDVRTRDNQCMSVLVGPRSLVHFADEPTYARAIPASLGEQADDWIYEL